MWVEYTERKWTYVIYTGHTYDPWYSIFRMLYAIYCGAKQYMNKYDIHDCMSFVNQYIHFKTGWRYFKINSLVVLK